MLGGIHLLLQELGELSHVVRRHLKIEVPGGEYRYGILAWRKNMQGAR